MLVLCPFPTGVAAGQRLKFEQYYEDWRSLGWDIDISPYMDRATWAVAFETGHYARKGWGLLKGHARRMSDVPRIASYDLVYLHMWATPVGTSLFERLTRRLAKRLIVDVEDNVLVGQGLSPRLNPNYVLKLLKGPGKQRFLIRTADHVIASSPFLADTCRKINERRAATYISSSVDTDRFVPSDRGAQPEVLTIGWTGTFSSRPYLDLLRPVLQQLARRRAFKLRVIGNFDYELPEVDLEVIRWSATHEVEDLQGIHIGLYPLPIDDWVSGKSGLKAIQYMAFGIPCVATDVGTTPMIIRDGDNGLLVRTEEEWLAALERLIDDPDLRVRLGEKARRDAVAKYSTKAIAAEYRKVLDLVMSSR